MHPKIRYRGFSEVSLLHLFYLHPLRFVGSRLDCITSVLHLDHRPLTQRFHNTFRFCGNNVPASYGDWTDGLHSATDEVVVVFDSRYNKFDDRTYRGDIGFQLCFHEGKNIVRTKIDS